MDAGEQRDEQRQRDRDVQEAECAPEPPRRLEHREDDGIAEREPLADDEVDEEPCDAGAVRILGDDGAEDQREIEPRPADELATIMTVVSAAVAINPNTAQPVQSTTTPDRVRQYRSSRRGLRMAAGVERMGPDVVRVQRQKP